MEERLMELEVKVESLQKEMAELKGQVSAQPIQTIDVIDKQIIFLEDIQNKCMQHGLYGQIAPIAKAILELVTLKKIAPFQQ